MATLEKPFLYIALGAVFPILFFLTGWWGSYLWAAEKNIPYFALGGLALGAVLDALVLKRLVDGAYQIPLGTMAFIYIFYAVGVFGFCMGVPLLVVLMGLAGGYYIGRRLKYNQAQPVDARRTMRLTSIFTSLVMALACAGALVLAASEATLANQINSMLKDLLEWNAGFDKQTILWFSLAAGSALAAGEYFLTRAAVKITFNQ